MDSAQVTALYGSIQAMHKFGFKLKDEQVRAVESAVNAKDSIVVLPTGFGKSACYYLPPLIMNEVVYSIAIYITLNAI
jgi:superfamily II DNA helicase RecQ